MLSCSTKLTCTAYSNPTSNITTAAGPIWAWTKMPRNHDDCRVRTRARSSRSPRWAACTIVTNAWRPEVTIVATRGSNLRLDLWRRPRRLAAAGEDLFGSHARESPHYWTGLDNSRSEDPLPLPCLIR